MEELSEIFDVVELKRAEECDVDLLQFLDFNDDFFSRSRNFKYCRLCKAVKPTSATVAHHALPSRRGGRLCKYEEVQQWLDRLVAHKDALAKMPEIQRHVKNILQLYHASTVDLYPPVVWHFNRLFPGERLQEPTTEALPLELRDQELSQQDEPGEPEFDEAALDQVLHEIHVEYKVSFCFFLSWFDLFIMEEYLSSTAPVSNTKPSALLVDDLCFDDLGLISLSAKLKTAFGVDVDWTALRDLTVAQVYTRYFQ